MTSILAIFIGIIVAPFVLTAMVTESLKFRSEHTSHKPYTRLE